VGQGGLPKSLPLMTSLPKTRIPKHTFFFRVQTRRLAAFFETFTGSVEHTGPEKFPRKATCVLVFFFPKIPEKQPDVRSVNTKYAQ